MERKDFKDLDDVSISEEHKSEAGSFNSSSNSENEDRNARSPASNFLHLSGNPIICSPVEMEENKLNSKKKKRKKVDTSMRNG